MTKAMIRGGAVTLVLALAALAAVRWALERSVESAAAFSPTMPPSTVPAEVHKGFIHGRIVTDRGATYKGRLRWGGDEEALWGHYFNGSKKDNPWVSHVPLERLTKERRPIKILGVEIARPERQVNLGRFFMARFGDIARIESRGVNVRVTLKSGAVFDLDRLAANDFDDRLRVWDGRHGVVDLDSRKIRTIEFFPAARSGAAPYPLHGLVRTLQGDFTGFVQWDREECVGTDELNGHGADGEVSIRFDTIRSIARRSPDSSRVTFLDGRQIVLSSTREVGQGNRGVYVDDRRYGRVLVSWDAFERVDFSPGGGGPAYGDFPPGRPLAGRVTTRLGRRLTGRLVYDLDESETTETLDAPSQGVDYTIPFSLITTIVPPGGEAQRARVILHSGEELRLEPAGDLSEENAGMLIYVDGRQRPEYVPWADVEQADFDHPPARVLPSGL